VTEVLRAFTDGARRVVQAPVLWVGVYVVTVLVALPLTISLRTSLEADLGNSVIADAMADGASLDWWQEYSERTGGLGQAFRPTIIGFAATLDNLSTLLDHDRRPAGVLGAVAAYIALWAFLAGGILDRYARQRPTRSEGFFQACGVYFVRFVRLGALAALAYYLLFAYVHAWLLTDLYGRLTRDLTVERSGFLIRLGLYALFGLLLLAVNLVVDYAKVRTVVEDRRSMVGAVLAGLRFVGRRLGRTGGLYMLNGSVFLILLVLYALAAPGAVPVGPRVWGAFFVGQLYLVSRLGLKLQFYASQTSFFQQQLAHAEYAAAPQPVWPESPDAEAIGNARGE